MIRIMTDMAADIPKEVAERLDIVILPFMIMFGDRQIVADIDLSPHEFYKLIEESEDIPSTSQMSPAELEDIYRSIGSENTIIHITMSARGSGINNTSRLVASQLEDEGFDITVIDSGMYSMTIGSAVIKAAEMAREGKEKQEIIDYVTEVYARDTAYFVVDDLTYLRKGGRIKATAMAISKVLDIKPILMVRDGLVEAFRKVRGLKRAMSTLVDFIEERMDNPSENSVLILHSNAQDKVDILEQMIKERINPNKIEYGDIGPIITSHAGTGVVGVYFKHKKPYTEYENN